MSDSALFEQVWRTIMSVLFQIGEEQCQKFPQEVAAFMSDKVKRLPFELGWLKSAISVSTHRRRGDNSGIMLSDGRLVTEKQVPQQLLPMYQLLLQAQVTGSDEDICRATDACSSVPKFQTFLDETGDLLAEIYCPGATNKSSSGTSSSSASASSSTAMNKKSNLTMSDIWESFFSCTFQIAEEALQHKLLLTGNVRDQDSWLYIGLTSLTAFDLVLRSAATGPFTLALGNTAVDEENIPAKGKDFFAAFVVLRNLVHDKTAKTSGGGLQQDQIAGLRKRVLWSDRDDAPEDLDLTSPTTPHLQKIMAVLQSIAIRASQEEEFKRSFDNMLMLVAAVA